MNARSVQLAFTQECNNEQNPAMQHQHFLAITALRTALMVTPLTSHLL